ncbi:hypothetical protein [Bradyrhizobium sp.]|jgi:hypothetical protein|uniref:hypothetical protein n=1 Tax=Bradyrhizobium sp. TaxID=376 RepID=UPI002DDC95D6|nr:hypothetical protein [Bradyrhizobium sp.]HEV2159452.1 hypothetical protein [Bradyrhizobium sp.]
MAEIHFIIDRFKFFAACCLIGVFSICFWFFAFWAFRMTTKTNSLSAIEIPLKGPIHAVWDAGLYREDSVGAGIYWVDDDTIVVRANKGPKPTTSEARRSVVSWLYLWRLGEKPRPYGGDPVAAAQSYCAARGEISYLQNTIDPVTGATLQTRWRGPVGHEREVGPQAASSHLSPSLAGRAPFVPSIERVDCELYFDGSMAGKHYVADPERRFYIDLGKEPTLARVHAASAEPLVLMRADGSDRIELPVSNAEASSYAFRMFEDVFYMWAGNLSRSPIDHFEKWKESDCWPIWRVNPHTAKTERLCVPFGPWSGAVHGGGSTTIDLAPTRVGLFFAANPVSAEEEHGLYLLRDRSVTQILPGYVRSPVTSPNGCRIALIYFPNREALGPYSTASSSIIVIDVCSPASNISSN